MKFMTHKNLKLFSLLYFFVNIDIHQVAVIKKYLYYIQGYF